MQLLAQSCTWKSLALEAGEGEGADAGAWAWTEAALASAKPAAPTRTQRFPRTHARCSFRLGIASPPLLYY
jgi:hypothetical protein